MNALEQLKSVLCDHTGKCSIIGSDEDCATVDRALQALAAPPVQEPDDSLLLCASDLEHSAIYDNHVEMQACIRAVASRIKSFTTKTAQPAVPDAITDSGENPEYRAGWNECRETMLQILKARTL
jgi:hypothetical protein